MTGSRFFLAGAAMSFIALALILFGGLSVLFVDVAFYVEAGAVLLLLAGIGLALREGMSRWGKPASFYLT